MQSQDYPYQSTILQAAIDRALSYVPQNGRERELARWVMEAMDQPEPPGPYQDEIPTPELIEAMRGLRGAQPLIDVHIVDQPCLVVINAPLLADVAREWAVWTCVRAQIQEGSEAIKQGGDAHHYRCVPIAPEIAAMRFNVTGIGPLTVVNTAQEPRARAGALRKLRSAPGRRDN